MSEKELQALAEHVLGLSHAGETEAVLQAHSSGLTRFANNYIHQNCAEDDVEVRVRVALGQKVGIAGTNDVSPGGLDTVVARAVELAELQPPDPYYPGLPHPGGVEAPVAAGYVPETAAFTPEDRARGVAPVCAAAEAAGLVAAGAFSTGVDALAVANSHGLWRYHEGTQADLHAVLMGDTGSGWASGASADVRTIDPGRIAAEAAGIARRAQGPAGLEPGDYPVVLAPDAVADILSFLGDVSFSGLAVHEGRSFLATRMGQRVMDPRISIWDDGLDPSGIPQPFDFEGVAKHRLPLVEAGVAKSAVWDARTAKMAGEGRASTGHALSAPYRWGPVPLNLFMAPGTADTAALLAGIERGVWVTRFWYTRVVHPMEVIVTGMTRDGTFLIENGQITRPVRNLRFTQSYLAAFDDVGAIGAETALILDGFMGSARVPAVRINRWTFTGATRE